MAGLAIACFLASATGLHGAFVFDDEGHIVSAENIRHLGDWQSWLLNNPRPVVTFTLAVNYAIGGLNTFSYHIFNVVFHVLASWTLFGIIRRTLVRLQARRIVSAVSPVAFAFAVSLLWAVHPLQTQAVTFVIQRSEVLMNLFGLLTLYAYIRGTESQPNADLAWFGVSILSCTMGMGCKAGLVTLPFVVLAYELLLGDRLGLVKTLLRRGWIIAGYFIAIAGLLAFTGLFNSLLSKDPGYAVTVGFGLKEHTAWQYLSSQPGVVLRYLSLAIWPNDLCIDYQWQVPSIATEIWGPAALILLIAIGTGVACLRKMPIGFAGLWFFLFLAPTSSIIPVKDLAMEHRMYLPLAGVVTIVVAAARRLAMRLGSANSDPTARRMALATLTVCVAVALMLRSSERNRDYESPASLWKATIDTRPHNARAWSNYGEALAKQNKMEWAADAFREAIKRDAKVPDVYYNLGNALQEMKQYLEAEQAYLKAIALSPKYLNAHIMLGNLYQNMNQSTKAEDSFRTALAQCDQSTDPTIRAKAFYNLGNCLARQSRIQEAREQYRLAVETAPRYDKAHFGLGWVLERMGEKEAALREYQQAFQLNPANRDAKSSMDALEFELHGRQTSAPN